MNPSARWPWIAKQEKERADIEADTIFFYWGKSKTDRLIGVIAD
jgi:hypothetical protein